MAGRVVLYKDVTCSLNRPDSSRPQAARSRVVCAKRCGSRTAAAPDCAKESNVEAALPPLWTLFTLRRGYVCAYTRRRHPGTRVDPPGSNLWPGGSGCIAMLSTRTIVQTRAAPKRRGVGLQRAKRRGSRHCRPGAKRRGSRTAASLDSLHAAAGLRWCVFAALVRLCAITLVL